MAEQQDIDDPDTLTAFLERVRDTRLADERYEVVRLLGRGGAGLVIEVRDRLLDRIVAVKQLRKSPDPDLARFVREARITARLDHPNIVPVYDVQVDRAGNLSFTMKRIEGQSLSQALREGLLPTTQARLEVLQKVCDAVAFAHSRGIVHRDIKPENVVVGEFGEVLLVDWGIACEHGEADNRAPAGSGVLDEHTAHGMVQGTPAYMAPGQARGERERGPWLDVYALGSLLYFLLIEEPPRKGSPHQKAHLAGTVPVDIPARHPGLTRDLRAVLARALAFERADRYPDVAALRADLDRVLAGLPVSARRYGTLERAGLWLRRHQRPVRRALALVALLALAAGMGLARYVQDLDTARQETARRAADALLGQGKATWEGGRPAAAQALVAEARELYTAQGRDDDPARIVLAAIAAETLLPELTVPDSGGGTGSATLSNDGSLLVAMTRQGTLAAWTVPGGTRIGTRDLPPHDLVQASVVDGRPGAVAAMGSLLRWHPLQGSDRAVDLPAPAIQMVSSGDCVALLLADGRVRVWTLPNLRPAPGGVEGMAELTAVSPGGVSVVVRPSTDVMAKGGTPYELRQTRDGALLGTAPWANGNADDALTTWAGIHNGGVDLTRFAAPGETVTLPLEGTLWAQLSGDGDRVVAWTAAEQLRSWTRSADGWQAGPDLRSNLPQEVLDIDGPGHRLVGGSGDGLAIWNTAGHVPTARLALPEGRDDPMSVAVSPDRALIAASTLSGHVHVWDRRTGRHLWEITTTSAGTRVAAFSPDGRFLATADRDGRSRVFDLTTGELAWTLESPDELVLSVAWDGSTLLQTGISGSIMRGDAAGAERIAQTADIARQIVVLADGRVAWTCRGDCPRLSVLDDDGEVEVWLDAETTLNTYALCPLDDGVVIGVADGEVLWHDGREATTIAHVPGPATTCATAGNLLALGGRDGWVRLLRTGTWEELGQVQAGLAGVSDVQFVGEHGLAMASGDGSVRLVDLRLYDLLTSATTEHLGGLTTSARNARLASLCAARGDWDCAASLGGEPSVGRVAVLAASGRESEALALSESLDSPSAAVWTRALRSKAVPPSGGVPQ
jgi:eukaryotic-like serine/threonine-protein kinase